MQTTIWISWRFIVAWWLRITSGIIVLVSLIFSLEWLNSDPTIEAIIVFLGFISASIGSFTSSFAVYKGTHRQEELDIRNTLRDERLRQEVAYRKSEYIERLRRRLEKDEAIFVPLPSEAQIKSKFALYADYLQTNSRIHKTEHFETIEQAIHKYDKFVLVGDPGAGKSTTLRHIAMQLVKQYQIAQRKHRFAHMPLEIKLGYSRNPPSATELIQYWWETQAEISGSPIEDIKQGHLWFLFDGLNEMPDSLTGAGSIHNRAASLKKFLTSYSGRAIVTCRTADYDRYLELGLPVVRILKLSKQEIRAFSQKRLGNRHSMFEHALQEEPGRAALASNPYALTMMIELFNDPVYLLPTNRDDLFNTYIRKRYDDNRREVFGRSRVNMNLSLLKKILGELAYRMMLEGHGTTVNETWAKRQIIGSRLRGLSRRGIRAALNLGIMIRNDDENTPTISFYHQSLYEHFVLPTVNLDDGNTHERVLFIQRLGTLKHDVVLPVLPKLTHCFITESDNNSDVSVYSAARTAQINICRGIQNEEARKFTYLLILDTSIKIILGYNYIIEYYNNSDASISLRPHSRKLFSPIFGFFQMNFSGDSRDALTPLKTARSLYRDLDIDLERGLYSDLARDLNRIPDPHRERHLYYKLAQTLCSSLNLSDVIDLDLNHLKNVRFIVHQELNRLAEKFSKTDF